MGIKKTNEWIQPDLLMADDKEFEKEIRELNRNRKPKRPKFKYVDAIRSKDFKKRLQNRLRSKGVYANANIITIFIACFIEEIRAVLFEGKCISFRFLGTFVPRINFKVVKSQITGRIEYDRPYFRPYFLFSRELRKQLLRLWLVILPVTEDMFPNWAMRRLARGQRRQAIRKQKRLLEQLAKTNSNLELNDLSTPDTILPDLSLPDLSVPDIGLPDIKTIY